MRETWPDEASVYVYFNNDPGGAAVINSAQFAELARQAGRSTTRTPEIERLIVRLDKLDDALPHGYVPSLLKIDVEGFERD